MCGINKKKKLHNALEILPVEFLQSCCIAVAHQYTASPNSEAH